NICAERSRMMKGYGTLSAAVCAAIVATTTALVVGQVAQRPPTSSTSPSSPAPKPAQAGSKPVPVSSHAQATPQSTTSTGADQNAIVKRYCITCHNDARKSKSGDLSLAAFDVAHAAQHPEVAEKMIRKLTAGMMPPPLVPRPSAAEYAALISTLETN